MFQISSPHDLASIAQIDALNRAIVMLEVQSGRLELSKEQRSSVNALITALRGYRLKVVSGLGRGDGLLPTLRLRSEITN